MPFDGLHLFGDSLKTQNKKEGGKSTLLPLKNMTKYLPGKSLAYKTKKSKFLLSQFSGFKFKSGLSPAIGSGPLSPPALETDLPFPLDGAPACLSRTMPISLCSPENSRHIGQEHHCPGATN